MLYVLLLCVICLLPVDRTLPATEIVQKPVVTEDELTEADKLSVQVLELFKETEFEEAVPLAKRALKIREQALKPGDPRIADAQSNLAELYLALRRPADSESLFKKAIKIYELDPKRHGKSLANALERLALLREVARQPKEAEDLYLRANALRERVIGADHAETKEALDRLATFYIRRKEFAKAIPMLRQQVAEGEKKYGPTDSRLGKLLERLSCVLHKNKESAEAEKIEARANSILYADAAAKAEPLLLSEASFDCRLLSNPHPDFPAAAKGGRFIGSITLIIAVDVNETGQVSKAQMVVGDPLFKATSEKAALSATLRPLVVNGQAVRFRGTITHSFSVVSSTRLVAVPGVISRP